MFNNNYFIIFEDNFTNEMIKGKNGKKDKTRGN